MCDSATNDTSLDANSSMSKKRSGDPAGSHLFRDRNTGMVRSQSTSCGSQPLIDPAKPNENFTAFELIGYESIGRKVDRRKDRGYSEVRCKSSQPSFGGRDNGTCSETTRQGFSNLSNRGRTTSNYGRGASSRGRDTSNHGRDTSSRGRDTSSRGRDTSSRGRDTSSHGRDTSSRGRDTSSRGRDTSSRGRDTSSRGRDTSSRGRDTSSRGRDTNSRGRGKGRSQGSQVDKKEGNDKDHCNENSLQRNKSTPECNPKQKHNKSKSTKVFILNMHGIDQLAREEPSVIILTLVAPHNGLQVHLTKNKVNPAMTIQLLNVLNRAFQSNIHVESQHHLMAILLESNLFAVHIPMMVASLPERKDEWYVFENLAAIFQAILNKMPKSAAKKLMDCVVLCTRFMNKQRCEIAYHEKIAKALSSVETTMTAILNEKGTQVKGKSKEKPALENSVEPPDDFRDLQIIPQVTEINSNKKPFLRKNVVVGKYKSVHHYLDVQFRLLREDFIAPLREGITNYVLRNEMFKGSKTAKHMMQDLHIYEEVFICKQVCMTDGIDYYLRFDIRRLRRIDWETSRRLIFGSLLCLSADNFKTVHFATVSERNPEDLAKGFIGVKFEGHGGEIELTKHEESLVYVMAESPAYFEGCRHILTGLQLIGNEMALKNYIVYLQNKLKPPSYLHEDAEYDMACVLETHSEHTYYSQKPSLIENSLQKIDYFSIFKDSDPLDEAGCDLGPDFNEQEHNGEANEEAKCEEYNTGVDISNDSECSIDSDVSNDSDHTEKLGAHQQDVAGISGSLNHCWSRVLDISCWPSGDKLGLDESQKRAMHLALTSSLAIIQGPPGTGKTYIGLKIVKILLHNHIVWNNDGITKPAPILVVCYTNHALDQFLEGILPFTKQMVRIGSRSKSSELAKHNIKNLRQRDRYSCYSTNPIRQRLKTIARQLQEVESCIECVTSYILHESTLIETLTGEDRQFVLRLQNGFSEMYGISPNDTKWSLKSYLATWLGLTLEPFVSETEIEAFNNSNQDVHTRVHFQTASEIKLDDSTSEIFPPPEDGDLIATEGAGTIEQRNRILEDEQPEIISVSATSSLRQVSMAVHIASLSNAQYHFPDETLDPQLAVSYLRKAQIRRDIAERELHEMEYATDVVVSCMTNMWTLPLAERWCLYRRWVYLFSDALRKRKSCLKIQYGRETRRLAEAVSGEDLAIMRQSDVVGMTTTGAARYFLILQELGPKIVVVEEAAAVLEAHVVTTLSRHTQHLILIGDHQQLRPTTTDYKLAKDYHLDVSLFERMIKNGIPYETLQLQHRMRPEISRLLVPLFYANLEDHPVVKTYENIKGMATNMFFLDHSYSEDTVGDSTSHANKFEAEFLVTLCFYLIQQGYQRERITILAAYSGQQFAICKLMKRSVFEGVHVTVVDNYQGEENDIILLSFVRSNEEGNIGFLRTENRVNVALSRARKGLYCIGNFTLLAGKCDFWRQLIADLQRDGKTGQTLTLTCQKHPEIHAVIENGSDFKNFAPEGGCLNICMEQLQCGHVCHRMCHPDVHKCPEPCTKVLCDLNHPCPLLCFEVCESCRVLVTKYFPTCGHSVEVECHCDISEILCRTLVERLLPCGHSAFLECHADPKDHTCLKLVERLLDCGHVVDLACHIDPSNTKCQVIVKRELDCNHIVDLKCHIDPFTYDCKQTVSHVFPHCEHLVSMKCHLITDELPCPCDCNYQLACGHICQLKCHPLQDPMHKTVLCSKPCQKTCESGHPCQKLCSELCVCDVLLEKVLPCGHKKSVACRKQTVEVICVTLCNRKMACGHCCKQPCNEKCGKCDVTVEKSLPNCGHVMRMKCMDNPSRVSCMYKCNRVLACGHFCSYVCSATCKCTHLIPTRGLCGHEILVPCHDRHTSKVMQTHFCESPCHQLMPCGHQCKGSCGKCYQGRVHVPCQEKCSRVQICGHPCELPCYRRCIPCKRKCPMRCPHERCSNKCGETCIKCKQPCNWRCIHVRCDKLCGEICTRPRCNEPCNKKLRCGHLCIGLCDEKCPTLCRVCNKNKLTGPDFCGFEYDENSRFIQLEYCRCCIDVKYMDYWMDKDQKKIQMKVCPKCNTTVYCSRRYKKVVYDMMLKVQMVKRRFLADAKDLEGTVGYLHSMTKAYRIWEYFPREAQRLQSRLHTNSSLQPSQLVVIQNQIKMLKCMLKLKGMPEDMCDQAKGYFDAEIGLLGQRLMLNEDHITHYELSQINREIFRIYLQGTIMDTQEDGFQPTKRLARAKEILASCRTLTDAEESYAEEVLKIMFTARPTTKFCNLERVEVLKIPTLTAGYWYICSRGHVYDCDIAESCSKVHNCDEYEKVLKSKSQQRETRTASQTARRGPFPNRASKLNESKSVDRLRQASRQASRSKPSLFERPQKK